MPGIGDEIDEDGASFKDAVHFSQVSKGGTARDIAMDAMRSNCVTDAVGSRQRREQMAKEPNPLQDLPSIEDALARLVVAGHGPTTSRKVFSDGQFFTKPVNDARNKNPNDILKSSVAREHAWKPQPTGKIAPYPPTLEDKDEQLIRHNMEHGGLKLEKPQGSSLHHAIDELTARGLPVKTGQFLGEQFQTFIVEHDWAGAFGDETDFKAGDEYVLPFEFTAFEFRVSGVRVIVMLGDGGKGLPIGVLLTGINGRWYVPSSKVRFEGGRLRDSDADNIDGYGTGSQVGMGGTNFLEFLARQIRAVCIMLDAKVAVVNTVRVSEKLAASRMKAGKTPMKDYHIVRLSNRHRASQLDEHGKSDRKGPRLHFRRGHWRHFTDHRTWINWMLVGNPDLGFIDKEYRL